MSLQAKRFALLMVALSIIAVALVACQTPTAPTQNNSNNGGVNVFHTPNPALQTPTPAFPPFTIGTWPSNYSPNSGDNLTIYVICRNQDASMQSAPKPAVGVGVTISIDPPFNNTKVVTTGADGIAAWTFQMTDTSSGQPVQVTVTATGPDGKTYVAQTFFTPSPAAASPSPSPSGTPGSGTPQPSPTSGG
ncbi:MAG: hypothetical protein OJF49_000450 [Ktedonobacterales bacterium]|jgi:hypothetical protein|nr:MAG: hypothetical protein OJF49_000450 [Ktedonobacterales bacterium]